MDKEDARKLSPEQQKEKRKSALLHKSLEG